MPELPEVETVVRQLRPLLTGRTITVASVSWARTVARPSAPDFCAQLAGRRFEALSRRAKYIVATLDDGRLLVGHLRMTGRFYVRGAGTGRDADLPADLDPKFIRARLALDDGRELLFADVRKFGRLALVSSLAEVLPALGPEPLSAEMDGDWLAAALAARRRLLKPLLLDQAFLAGLGNIYVDESLHAAGLHPLQSSDRVPHARAGVLAAAIRDVLTRAIVAEGSSFDTFYRTPAGQPGGFQDEFAVYGREGRPCRTCGAGIRRIVVGQRGTHFCPRCQPAPRRRPGTRGPGTRGAAGR
jgi:formamidopyrimidine-DNA glycosylase